MKNISRNLLVLLLLALSSISAMAATLSGKINDENGEPLASASVRILSARDSSFIKGIATDDNGKFALSLNKGRYLLQITYIGYQTHTESVAMGDNNKTLKPIALTPAGVELGEATIVAVKTPIKVMEDTVEFNADTYKTQPNAVVEDLLKRLPGVEVGSDGTITANGKTVTKILVDGEEFFSDDPQVASKNLPVSMIDKLQVVDRKSDLARLTGVDDGEEETVINLTVKKDMKNGWFGNAEVGYGTDDRYKATFMVNRFWNNNQLTLLGNFNNINELGFSDGGSRFRRFGGTNGITTSQAFGINFTIGSNEKLRIGGNVMYSHSDRNTLELRDRQYLFTDSTSYAYTGKAARDKGHNIRGDFRLKWEPDSFNTFEFRPSFSVNLNHSTSLDSTLTSAGDALRTPVSRSFNTGDSEGTSFEFTGELIYNHKFRSRPGRAFSMQLRYQLSNVNEDENTYSHNRFYLFNDSLDLYDQYADNHTWSNMVQARATWTEPLGDVKNGRFLTFAYRVQYKWNNADKLTYDHPIIYPDGVTGDPIVDYTQLIFNEELSNSFRNDYFNQDIRLGFKQVRKTYTIDAGLSLVPTMSRSEDLINSARNIPTRWVWNFAPFLRYRYKLGKSRSLNINYMGRSSQPTMTQLQPVADMSDPLRIVIGNPNLDPSFSHNIRLRFQDFNAESQRSIMTMANIQVVQNSIISKTDFDNETGGQTTTYDNVNGVWSARLMTMYSQPLRNKAWSISNHLFGSYSSTVGYNNGLRNRSGSFMVGESFGIAWRPDNLEFELRPFYNLQSTRNTVQTGSNRDVHTYGGYFNGTYITPIGVTLNTDLSFSNTEGYSQGYDTRQWLWNATLSYQFLPGNAATVALKVYDLLQQKSNVRRTVTANYIDDAMYNSLTRYFMVSFTYKFNTFGAGNEPKINEMGGPGMGRPGRMGPPR